MADGSRYGELSDLRPFEAVMASPEDFQSCVCSANAKTKRV